MASEDKTLGSGAGTILVVEDEQAQRETLCAFLGEDYTMLEAANGAEAINHVKDNAVDLAFLDLRLGPRGRARHPAEAARGGARACR
jgi:CheY-like chemotaxis protein